MATKINLDTSERVDITCRKGDTFSLRLTITNADDTAGFAAGDIFLMEDLLGFTYVCKQWL